LDTSLTGTLSQLGAGVLGGSQAAPGVLLVFQPGVRAARAPLKRRLRVHIA